MKKGERVTHRGSTGLQEHPPRVADPSAKRVTSARAWAPPRRALGFAPGACGGHDARERGERGVRERGERDEARRGLAGAGEARWETRQEKALRTDTVE
jgi:hypothetical protein